MPMAYLKGEPLKKRFFFGLKNIINRMQRRYQPNVHQAIKRADILLASTPDEQRVFKEIYLRDSYFVNDTGCDISTEVQENQENAKLRFARETLELLWVAKFDFRKQLGLAIRVMGELKGLNVRLNIAGGGANAEDYKKLAEELGVADICVFHGVVPHEKVLSMMQSADIFFFTSIKEESSTVILEAIGSALPIVCFDTCGFGPIVDDSIGRKINISNPEQSIKDFAEVIRDIYHHRELLPEMSKRCVAKQKELSWNYKARFVVGLYEQLMDQKKK